MMPKLRKMEIQWPRKFKLGEVHIHPHQLEHVHGLRFIVELRLIGMFVRKIQCVLSGHCPLLGSQIVHSLCTLVFVSVSWIIISNITL